MRPGYATRPRRPALAALGRPNLVGLQRARRPSTTGTLRRDHKAQLEFICPSLVVVSQRPANRRRSYKPRQEAFRNSVELCPQAHQRYSAQLGRLRRVELSIPPNVRAAPSLRVCMPFNGIMLMSMPMPLLPITPPLVLVGSFAAVGVRLIAKLGYLLFLSVVVAYPSCSRGLPGQWQPRPSEFDALAQEGC